MNKLFIHIGFHKTGTSWLQKMYFENNSDINLINDYRQPWNDKLCVQIIQKSDCEFDHDYCISLSQDRYKNDKVNVLSAERLSGHPISGGFDYKMIAKRLKSIFPDAKIIITSREVKAFIISVYKQIIKEGYPGTLEDFLFNHAWKKAGCTKTYLFQEKIIESYIELFDKKNVLVLNFEDFKSNKNLFFDQLNDFLGIKKFNIDNVIRETIINPTYSDKRLRALKNLNRIRKTEYNPYPLISINSRTIRKLSYFISFFLTDKELIDDKLLNEFIGS